MSILSHSHSQYSRNLKIMERVGMEKRLKSQRIKNPSLHQHPLFSLNLNHNHLLLNQSLQKYKSM
jgi:hypothetical protein